VAIGGRTEHSAFDPPAPVPVDRLPGPQGAGEPQPLHHAADPSLKRHARRDEFRADIRHVAGDAGAKHQPALADLVEGGELVRQHDRIAQCRQKHRGPELHLLRPCGRCGEQGQRVVPWPRQERVTDPHRVEAEPLRPRGEVEQRAGFWAALHDPLPCRQQVSYARRHVSSPGDWNAYLAPLRRIAGEREGPAPEAWRGEVVPELKRLGEPPHPTVQAD